MDPIHRGVSNPDYHEYRPPFPMPTESDRSGGDSIRNEEQRLRPEQPFLGGIRNPDPPPLQSTHSPAGAGPVIDRPMYSLGVMVADDPIPIGSANALRRGSRWTSATIAAHIEQLSGICVAPEQVAEALANSLELLSHPPGGTPPAPIPATAAIPQETRAEIHHMGIAWQMDVPIIAEIIRVPGGGSIPPARIDELLDQLAPAEVVPTEINSR